MRVYSNAHLHNIHVAWSFSCRLKTLEPIDLLCILYIFYAQSYKEIFQFLHMVLHIVISWPTMLKNLKYITIRYEVLCTNILLTVSAMVRFIFYSSACYHGFTCFVCIYVNECCGMCSMCNNR